MCCDLLGASVFRCLPCQLGRGGYVVSCLLTWMYRVLVTNYACAVSCDPVNVCVYPSVWVSVSKWREVGVFEGDVPLPRVFSFLSFKLIASDAPSGICEGRGEEGRGEGGKTRGQRAWGQGWVGVHQISIIKHALKGRVVLRGVYTLVSVCVCQPCVDLVWSARAWLGSLKSSCGEMDWTASQMNPDC